MSVAEISSQTKDIQMPADLNRYCNIPEVILPADIMKILGVKRPKMLAKMPIPRCYLYPGSSKYVILRTDFLDYLRSQRDITEVNLDD